MFIRGKLHLWGGLKLGSQGILPNSLREHLCVHDCFNLLEKNCIVMLLFVVNHDEGEIVICCYLFKERIIRIKCFLWSCPFEGQVSGSLTSWRKKALEPSSLSRFEFEQGRIWGCTWSFWFKHFSLFKASMMSLRDIVKHSFVDFVRDWRINLVTF